MKKAFSLVELSIVLVILGLLVGGVLSGQALIRASELRSVSVDAARYQAAVYSFRDKYFSLPGDMSNAVSFWGQAASCPGDETTPSLDRTTCNGDGNGYIGSFNGAATFFERYRAWQQLANAGLVEGTYTGTRSDSGTLFVSPGLNIPRSKINQAGFHFVASATPIASAFTFADPALGNSLFFGKPRNTALGINVTETLLPEDAWNIDTKMDDGKPGSGKVMSSPYNACTGGVTDMVTAVYDLQQSTISCYLIFKIH